MTIGERALEAVRNRAKERGITFRSECEQLQTSDNTALSWKKKGTNPSSYVLAEMCRQGYDVIYILTGEKT